MRVECLDCGAIGEGELRQDRDGVLWIVTPQQWAPERVPLHPTQEHLDEVAGFIARHHVDGSPVVAHPRQMRCEACAEPSRSLWRDMVEAPAQARATARLHSNLCAGGAPFKHVLATEGD